MRVASSLGRASTAGSRRGAGHPPARDVAFLASAVGNRAFARQVARCAGSGHGHAPGEPCCEECAEEQRRGRLTNSANHDNPSRPWTDTLLEVGAGLAFGPAGWAWAAAHAAAGGGGAGAGGGAACAAGNSAKRDTVKIRPVVIANDNGSAPTAAPTLDKVQEIWKKCCIDVQISATKTVCKTDYKTLDESPNDTPTAEERQLFADAGAFDGITVFVPEEFAMDGKHGKDINGGGATYDAGKARPKVVVVEGSLPEVVAHEVGHAVGHLAHDNNETVMKPTGKHDTANKTAVSAGVCASARTGAVLTASADDCCMDPR
jgi:hypothetical protein